jgi:hypothetical protein
MRKTKCKKFIIKNFDKFEYDSKNDYFIMPIKNSYYTEITLLSRGDNRFYSVCYWGNRKSLLWNIKKDFYFNANIIRKSNNTKIDSQIIDFIKSKKNK